MNEEQVELNKERAALFQAAVGGGALPTAVVMDEGPALLEWQGGDKVPTVTAARAATARAGAAPPAASGAPAASQHRLLPEAAPAVDFVGRDFVDGARPHPPAVPVPGQREYDSPQQYGPGDESKAMKSRFLDEKVMLDR